MIKKVIHFQEIFSMETWKHPTGQNQAYVMDVETVFSFFLSLYTHVHVRAHTHTQFTESSMWEDALSQFKIFLSSWHIIYHKKSRMKVECLLTVLDEQIHNRWFSYIKTVDQHDWPLILILCFRFFQMFL